MKLRRLIKRAMFGLGILLVAAGQGSAQEAGATEATDEALAAAIRANSEELVAAFNAGKAPEVSRMFLPSGELVDESGLIHKGNAAIEELMTALFEKFPGVQVSLNMESVRSVGPAIIEEGTRTMTVKDGTTSATFRYIDVWVKTEGGWKLASHREVAEDPVPTATDYLQPLAWLEGDWINEGADGKVDIKFRWSDEKTFLLGEFTISGADGVPRKTSQRIGWDARSGCIRSWLFDADGGFSEAIWTVVGEGDEIVAQSNSVNPDGSGATATLTIKLVDKDHFTFGGTERIVGGDREPDFELTITRSPKLIRE